MDKIAIILDTNFAHSKNKNDFCNFDKFYINGYDDLIGFIERRDLIDKIDIFLPEIVMMEIFDQRNKTLKSEIAKLRSSLTRFKNSNIFNFEEIDHNDKGFSTSVFLKELENIKRKENILIVPMPEEKAILFNEILEMSVIKKAPFQEGESDKGFKDSILLLSILNYFKKLDYSKVILFSEDNGFKKCNLEKIKKDYDFNFFINYDKNIQDFISKEFNLKDRENIKNNLRDFLEEKSISQLIERKIYSSVRKNNFYINRIFPLGYRLKGIKIEKTNINEISDDEYNVSFSFEAFFENDGYIKSIFENLEIIFRLLPNGSWDIK